jgi:hypothetical protein
MGVALEFGLHSYGFFMFFPNMTCDFNPWNGCNISSCPFYFTIFHLKQNGSTLSDLGLQHDQVITVSLTIACLVYGWVGIVVYATFGCSAVWTC